MINVDDRLLDRLNEKQYWLLTHLVKRINKDGVCWPSMETILKDTGWKDWRTVNKVRDELVEMKILSYSPRMKKGGGQTSHLFNINTDLIGVFMPANRLQSLHQEAPLHEMQGRGVHEMQGPPLHVVQGEVLNNEVLTIEETPPKSEYKPIFKIGQSAEEVIDQATEVLRQYFTQNPERMTQIPESAQNRVGKKEFGLELMDWIRYNANNRIIMQDPVKHLTSGPGNFTSWLAKDWCRKKYEPKAAKPAFQSKPEPQVPEYRKHVRQERKRIEL
jgi:hypothetical protein